MAQIKEFMTTNVQTITSDKTVVEAAKMMKAGGIGSIIVTENGKPVAMVTERDMVNRVIAEGVSPQEKRVKDIMSSPLVTVSPDQPLKSAAQLMASRSIRRLPVVKGGKLVGIITETDLARAEPHELL